MKPTFIITIDTEPDNQWIPGKSITLENLYYIPRFQELSEKYSFKPVWLTEFNVAKDLNFISYMKEKNDLGLCEIGIHPHAWTTPPFINITPDDYVYKPYLIDYPKEIMRDKFLLHFNTLKSVFGDTIKTHRSGRWAFDQRYFNILKEFGIIYDCTINPRTIIPPSSDYFPNNSCDYSEIDTNWYEMNDLNFKIKGNSNIYEIPFTILKSKNVFNNLLPKKITRRLFPVLQLRPNGKNLQQLFKILSIAKKTKMPFIQFMLHSSELMPGCNPTFETKESIESLYSDLNYLFEASAKDFEGRTIKEFMSLVI